MNATPIVVTQHHLNLTGQNVLTFVSWALTIICSPSPSRWDGASDPRSTSLSSWPRWPGPSPRRCTTWRSRSTSTRRMACRPSTPSSTSRSRCARSCPDDLLCGGRIATTATGNQPMVAVGPVRAVPGDVLRGELRCRIPCYRRDPRSARQPGGGIPVHRTQHRLRGHPGSLRCRVRAGI